MNIELRLNKTDTAELLNEYIERRLRFAIGRFGERLGRITVSLSRKSGKVRESTCRMTIEILGCGEVTVYEADRDPFAAIDRAAGRIGRRLDGELERARNGRGGQDSMRLVV
jgi:putative sigma-54 modulation protein